MNIKELETKLKNEGFPIVYEWKDTPNAEYPSHAHKGKVSFYITRGGIDFLFEGKKKMIFKVGDRYDVPIGLEHTAKVGIDGCDWVVGQELEEDGE